MDGFARRRALVVGAIAGLAVAIGAGGPGPESVARAASPAGQTTVTGVVTQTGGQPLPGMRVSAEPLGTTGCTPGSGCVSTYSGLSGRYVLTGLSTGTYELTVLDGSDAVGLRRLTVVAPAPRVTASLTLGPAPVPAGTVVANTTRDLRRLNAERTRDGVGGGVVLNPRWSEDCAAHVAYEVDNSVLQAAEDPTATGASAGGAWAGLNSDLAESRWTANASPWEDAPIHLLALLAPSLTVTGISDSAGLQCAVTFPGMLRDWSPPDRVTTVPRSGAYGVPTRELAHESPFTPVQFVGLPASQVTGPELLVYLNRTGMIGQAPVRITRASLSGAGHRVAVRWVDTATRTVGPYLVGGIVIPPRPLRRATTYRASVTVRDGSGTLTRRWSFTTR